MVVDVDSVVSVVGAVLGAGGIGGAVAYIWKERDAFYRAHIDRLEKEIEALRLRIDKLQDQLISQAAQVTEAHRVQSDTYQRLARSLEEQRDTLKQALGVKT